MTFSIFRCVRKIENFLGRPVGQRIAPRDLDQRVLTASRPSAQNFRISLTLNNCIPMFRVVDRQHAFVVFAFRPTPNVRARTAARFASGFGVPTALLWANFSAAEVKIVCKNRTTLLRCVNDQHISPRCGGRDNAVQCGRPFFIDPACRRLAQWSSPHVNK